MTSIVDCIIEVCLPVIHSSSKSSYNETGWKQWISEDKLVGFLRQHTEQLIVNLISFVESLVEIRDKPINTLKKLKRILEVQSKVSATCLSLEVTSKVLCRLIEQRDAEDYLRFDPIGEQVHELYKIVKGTQKWECNSILVCIKRLEREQYKQLKKHVATANNNSCYVLRARMLKLRNTPSHTLHR